MNLITEQVILEKQVCPNCGCVFALPEHMLNQRRQDGASFYCPSGHPQCYREAKATRLERELQQERQRHDQTRADRDRIAANSAQTVRRLNATKGSLTRFKNKSANGKCNCCGKEFLDLKLHMSNCHPAFVEKAKKETNP